MYYIQIPISILLAVLFIEPTNGQYFLALEGYGGTNTELLLEIPGGLKTGVNPELNFVYKEIADAFYQKSAIASLDGSGNYIEPTEAEYRRELHYFAKTALEGDYALSIRGIDTGPFEVILGVYLNPEDETAAYPGNFRLRSFGIAEVGSTSTYTFKVDFAVLMTDPTSSDWISYSKLVNVSTTKNELQLMLNQAWLTQTTHDALLVYLDAAQTALNAGNITSAETSLQSLDTELDNRKTELEAIESTISGAKPYEILKEDVAMMLDFLSQSQSFSKTIDSGWSMIGLPLEVPVPNYTAIFTSVSLKTEPFGYDIIDNSYEQVTDLEIGKSYWINAEMAGNQYINGKDVPSIDLTLVTGWNMIAGPNCSIDFNSIVDNENILVSGSLYDYGNGYEQATSLEPGVGYWVKTTGPGLISMNCNPSKVSVDLDILPPESFGELEVRNAQGQGQRLYFGSSLPENNVISYLLPPQGPSGQFDELYSKVVYGRA